MLELCVSDVETCGSNANGVILWGVTRAGDSVAVAVGGFRHYFWFPAPREVDGPSAGGAGAQRSTAAGATDGIIDAVRDAVNVHVAAASRGSTGENAVEDVEIVSRLPLMYYRPGHLELEPFLRVVVSRPAVQRRAAAALESLAAAGEIPGFSWEESEPSAFEGDKVPYLLRFMVDSNISAGTWVRIAAGHYMDVPSDHSFSTCAIEVATTVGALQSHLPPICADESKAADDDDSPFLELAPARALSFRVHSISQSGQSVVPARDPVVAIANWIPAAEDPDDTGATRSGGVSPLELRGRRVIFTTMEAGDGTTKGTSRGRSTKSTKGGAKRGRKESTGAGEPQAVWTSVTRLGATEFRTFEREEDLLSAWAQFVVSEVDPDLLCGFNCAGVDLNLVRSRFKACGLGDLRLSRRTRPVAADDGVWSLADSASSSRMAIPSPIKPKKPPSAPIEFSSSGDDAEASAGSDVEVVEADTSGWSCAACTFRNVAELPECEMCETARPPSASSLRASKRKRKARRPETQKTARAAGKRRAVDSGHGARVAEPVRAVSGSARPPRSSISPTGPIVRIREVTTYSKNWVRQQRRMTATSNQQCFRAVGLSGRLVVDVLRPILTGHTLSFFSLDEACAVLLHTPKERLPQTALDALWRGHPVPDLDAVGDAGGDRASDPAALADQRKRVLLYLLCDALYALRLARALQIVPNAVEMARVTGLSFDAVLYRGQMQRTWSMLLKAARERGYVVGGPTTPATLDDGPFLLHPIENKTAGLYNEPVAVLDFASLYPSIYQAYNLCYSTLLHPSDADLVAKDSTWKAFDVGGSNGGAVFVRADKRRGVLPSLLTDLVTARRRVKQQLKSVRDGTIRHATLNGRQLALKTCANALYGFTGAPSSPLVCGPLAEACIFTGRSLCERAMRIIHAQVGLARRGARALATEYRALREGARVVYGQTDSLMVHFQGKDITVEESVMAGEFLATAVSEQFAAPPIKLEFERVLCPFLLLHVNRYAGVEYGDGGDVVGGRNGQLLIKGVESERRMSPSVVRRAVACVLHELLVTRDPVRAKAVAEAEIRQLLSGGCRMSDLIMTAGLWRADSGDIKAAAEALLDDGGASDDEDGSDDGRSGAASGKGRARARPKQKAEATSAVRPGRGGTTVPHVALAGKISNRDPDRAFLLGERVPFVLLQDARGATQASQAEDPLTALLLNLQPDVAKYWTNKMKVPLTAIFERVLGKSELRDLLEGAHTRVRGTTSGSASSDAPGSLAAFFLGDKVAADAAASHGRGSSGPSGAGGFFGAAGAAVGGAGKAKKPSSSGSPSKQQRSIGSFFGKPAAGPKSVGSSTASPATGSGVMVRCLLCKAKIPAEEALCEHCIKEDGFRRATLSVLSQVAAQEQELSEASASAARLQLCSGVMSPIAGEGWLARRLQSCRDLAKSTADLQRLETASERRAAAARLHAGGSAAGSRAPVVRVVKRGGRLHVVPAAMQ